MLEELCKRIQNCCATLWRSRNKRNVGSCWLKSLTGFKLCATTRNNIQQHATGCANGRNMHVTSNNVGSCWSTMLRLFASSLIIKNGPMNIWMNESVNEQKRERKNERRNKLRYNEWINVITIFGAVKRGSLIRCAISSPLSSADLQNKVTDNLLIRQQNRFFTTVYCNTASFLTFAPKRYKKIFVPEFILLGMRRKFTRTL